MMLAACSLAPPNDAVKAAGGMEQIEQRFQVAPLDPALPLPLLRQAEAQLAKTDPEHRFAGVTYRLTEHNRLPPHWLLQTPDAWGLPAAAVTYYPLDCQNCDPDFRLPPCKPDCRCAELAASVAVPGTRPKRFCVGQSDTFVDVFYRLVVSANHFVDIALLQPPADFRFLSALRNAVTRLAYSGRSVTVRVIVGSWPQDGTDPSALLGELIRDAAAVPRSRLRLFVGAVRSCDAADRCGALSWNHAKIVAIDGKRALVGGHNMWTKDYLAAAPVHDLSMEVEGTAAEDAHHFADALWQFLCAAPRQDRINASYSYSAGDSGIGPACLAHSELPQGEPRAMGQVPILSVGRLAYGITRGFADQSLVARDLMLGAATNTIRMVQQDVAFALPPLPTVTWPNSALTKIASLLIEKHGDIYIVLSNYQAAGPTGTYSNGVRIEDVARKIRDVAQSLSQMPTSELNGLLCAHLHLAPLRFGPDGTWPNHVPIGVHAKFWMIDDRAFYIGSENLYPSELQEFGFIVEDHAAAQLVLRDYWDQVWRWSAPAAISGAGADKCVFTETPGKKL
jgi:phosphatidylserine/phosphatidylglycerophosphate/cardiolipin synthase-like enzyme